MTMKRALQEAYASGDAEGITITSVEVDHASLDAPIRLVRNVDSELGEPGDTIALPLEEGGPKVAHLLCGFSLIAPGADKDGPTDGKFEIDNVSDQLHALMKDLVGYDEALLVTFRQYQVLPGQIAAVTGPDDDTLSGLEMDVISVGADRAEGTIAWPDGRQQNVPTGPHAFFSRDEYPGLFT